MSAPYRPGQPPWPENQPQRPDRPPPIQFHEEQPPGGTSAMDWALRIVGLVAVAVISGFVWWFFNNGSPSEPAEGSGGTAPTTEQSEGEFEFTPEPEVRQPIVHEDCGAHSYGQTQDFFQDKPCEKLTRALYVTEVPDGRTVYTSVSVVRMPDEATATELRELTDTDKTGNVKDLVREEVVTIGGLDALSGGGYSSTQHGREVVIVESDFAPEVEERDSEADIALLKNVSTDALRLGTAISTDSG